MGGNDPVVRVLTPKQGLMGVVTTPPWVVTTTLVVTTPVRRGCKLSVRSRRAECPGRTRSGPSPRVWSAGTWVFGHWEADPAPYGARTVTRSTRGGAQPTLYPKNRCHKRLGRRRFGFSNEALGVTVSLRVLAQSDQSTNGRLAHNQVVSGGDIRGLTRAAHPHRGAQKLRYEVRSDRFAIVRSYVRERRNGHGAD